MRTVAPGKGSRASASARALGAGEFFDVTAAGHRLRAHGSRAQVEAIARGVSGPVETWIIPDCGHSPHLEARDAVLERMAAFIGALPA